MKIRNEKLKVIWSGTPAIWALVAAVGALMSLQSCSLRDREVKYGVRIQMSNQNVVQQMMTNANVANPTSWNTVQCIGLNIMGDGIPADTSLGCSDPNVMGMMIGTVPASGGRLEAMVPAGAGRKIQLIGANSSLGYCPSFNEMAQRKLVNPNEEILGKPYLLGEAITDVFGDVSVRINPVFDSSKIAFQSCEGGGGSSSPSELTVVQLNGSSALLKGGCTAVNVEARTSNDLASGVTVGLSVESLFDTTANAALPASDVGFYSDTSCTNSIGSAGQHPINISLGSTMRQKTVYLKVNNAAATKLDLKVTTTAPDWLQPVKSFDLVGYRLQASMSPAPTFGTGSCQGIMLQKYDMGNGLISMSSEAFELSFLNYSPGGSSAPAVQLYSSASCATGAYSGVSDSAARSIKFSILASGFTTYLYMKINNPGQLGILFSQPSATTPHSAQPAMAHAQVFSATVQVPTLVTGLSGLTIQKVVMGTQHQCVLVSDGTVRCWGGNNMGQVGSGSYSSYSPPIQVPGLAGVSDISAGAHHTCAVISDGTIKCWGSNISYQIGSGSSSPSQYPSPQAVSIIDGSSIVAYSVSAGFQHTCALTSAGVYCWGDGQFGQLGNNSTTSSLMPLISSASNMSQVSAGGSHSCSTSTVGAAFCWGLNGSGQVGDNTVTNKLISTAVSGLSSGVAKVVAGSGFSCAQMSSGAVKCWGANSSGVLGDGSLISRQFPVTTQAAPAVVDIVAGGSHACARHSDGKVSCWGSNGFGQVGVVGPAQHLVPVEVPQVAGASQIAVGFDSSCALLNNQVYCWGSNLDMRLGL